MLKFGAALFNLPGYAHAEPEEQAEDLEEDLEEQDREEEEDTANPPQPALTGYL